MVTKKCMLTERFLSTKTQEEFFKLQFFLDLQPPFVGQKKREKAVFLQSNKIHLHSETRMDLNFILMHWITFYS